MKTAQLIATILTGALAVSGSYAEEMSAQEYLIRKANPVRQQTAPVVGAQNIPATPVGIRNMPNMPATVNKDMPVLTRPMAVAPLPVVAPAPVVPAIAPKVLPPPVMIVSPPPPVIAPVVPPILTVMPTIPVIKPPVITPPVIVIPPPPLVLLPPPIITVPIVYVPPPKVYRVSDRRLKTNINRIGTHRLGIGIYEYDYVWGEHAVGVMADEVLAAMPDAVLRGDDGYYRVDYSKL